MLLKLLARLIPSAGTRSLLFGAHCFFLHPWFVLAAWVRLYGWPRHLAYYVAFFVHDLGYWGKEQMDDDEGERHPELGARIMSRLFDQRRPLKLPPYVIVRSNRGKVYDIGPWGQFALLHSRFLAKRLGLPYSRLCVADKLAIALTPAWVYLPLVRASGEVYEYMATYATRTISGQDKTDHFSPGDEREWYRKLQEYMRSWVEAHANLQPDTWTNRTSV